MTYRYFAYGSNLDAQHFAEWSSEHDYAGKSLGDGQPAVLDEYTLALTVPSRYWMGAVGTLAPRPGGAVYGVQFSLPDEDADMIRHKEGVASGLYREIDVEVRYLESASGGQSDLETTIELVAARAFVSTAGRSLIAPPPPSRRWLEVVLRGAEAHKLPAAWIDELRGKLG